MPAISACIGDGLDHHRAAAGSDLTEGAKRDLRLRGGVFVILDRKGHRDRRLDFGRTVFARTKRANILVMGRAGEDATTKIVADIGHFKYIDHLP